MSLATFCHGKTATSQKFEQFTRSLVENSLIWLKILHIPLVILFIVLRLSSRAERLSQHC